MLLLLNLRSPDEAWLKITKWKFTSQVSEVNNVNVFRKINNLTHGLLKFCWYCLVIIFYGTIATTVFFLAEFPSAPFPSVDNSDNFVNYVVMFLLSMLLFNVNCIY